MNVGPSKSNLKYVNKIYNVMIRNFNKSHIRIIESPIYKIRYVVTSTPSSDNIFDYRNLLLENDVKTVVRISGHELYDSACLTKCGIKVVDFNIEDGCIPNKKIYDDWINLVKTSSFVDIENKENKKTFGIHCVSGLGRAPLMVGIALIVLDKMDPLDAITLLRSKIPHCLNYKQFDFLLSIKSNKQKCTLL